MNRLLVAAAAVSLLGAGCWNPREALEKKIGEKVAEGIVNSQMNGQGNVDFTENGFTVKGNDGETFSMGSNTLPDGFPGDVPVYEGTVSMSGSSMKDGKSVYTVILTVKDGATAVATWYDTRMSASGWTKAESWSAQGSEGRKYTRETDSLAVSIIGGAEEGTMVTLVAEMTAQK